jgi:hypothetical protein
MPIPSPTPNEDRNAFISRCMGDETMKKDYEDSKQRIVICLDQTKGEENCLLNEVQNVILSSQEYDEEWDEFVHDIEAFNIYDEDEKLIAAEKNGRKVTLNKPFRTPDGPKKFSVYVKNDSGNVVKVNFGDPNMEIKKDIPARRKSFRARMRCDTPGPKYKARYWACKSW